MTFKKPINIGYELVFYSFLVSILLHISWNNLLNKNIVNSLWDYGIWGLFVVLLFSITTRAVRTDESMLAPSAMLFGFFVGILLWTLFVLSEVRSEGISINIVMVMSILFVGCLTALVAWLIAIILSKLLARLRGR